MAANVMAEVSTLDAASARLVEYVGEAGSDVEVGEIIGMLTEVMVAIKGITASLGGSSHAIYSESNATAKDVMQMVKVTPFPSEDFARSVAALSNEIKNAVISGLAQGVGLPSADRPKSTRAWNASSAAAKTTPSPPASSGSGSAKKKPKSSGRPKPKKKVRNAAAPKSAGHGSRLAFPGNGGSAPKVAPKGGPRGRPKGGGGPKPKVKKLKHSRSANVLPSGGPTAVKPKFQRKRSLAPLSAGRSRPPGSKRGGGSRPTSKRPAAKKPPVGGPPRKPLKHSRSTSDLVAPRPAGGGGAPKSGRVKKLGSRLVLPGGMGQVGGAGRGPVSTRTRGASNVDLRGGVGMPPSQAPKPKAVNVAPPSSGRGGGPRSVSPPKSNNSRFGYRRETKKMVRPPKFSPKPVAATAPAKKYAKCLYTFDGGEPDELPMRKGEIIELIDDDDDEEWWEGKLGGATGLFPSNHVKRHTPSSTPAKPASTNGEPRSQGSGRFGGGVSGAPQSGRFGGGVSGAPQSGRFAGSSRAGPAVMGAPMPSSGGVGGRSVASPLGGGAPPPSSGRSITVPMNSMGRTGAGASPRNGGVPSSPTPFDPNRNYNEDATESKPVRRPTTEGPAPSEISIQGFLEYKKHLQAKWKTKWYVVVGTLLKSTYDADAMVQDMKQVMNLRGCTPQYAKSLGIPLGFVVTSLEGKVVICQTTSDERLEAWMSVLQQFQALDVINNQTGLVGSGLTGAGAFDPTKATVKGYIQFKKKAKKKYKSQYVMIVGHLLVRAPGPSQLNDKSVQKNKVDLRGCRIGLDSQTRTDFCVQIGSQTLFFKAGNEQERTAWVAEFREFEAAKSLPQDWKRIGRQAGMTEAQLEDPEYVSFVVNFVNTTTDPDAKFAHVKDGVPDLEGWLQRGEKKGPLTRYNRRYFRLFENFLYAYREPSDLEPEIEIAVAQATLFVNPKKDLCVGLTAAGKTVFLAAESQFDYNKWLDALATITGSSVASLSAGVTAPATRGPGTLAVAPSSFGGSSGGGGGGFSPGGPPTPPFPTSGRFGGPPSTPTPPPALSSVGGGGYRGAPGSTASSPSIGGGNSGRNFSTSATPDDGSSFQRGVNASKSSVGGTAVAIMDYIGDEGDELSFYAGDTINCVMKTNDPEWAQGECNGQSGFFPTSHTRIQASNKAAWAINPDVSGWILKANPTGLIKKYRKRYFAVVGSVAYYYQTPQDAAPAGEIVLSNYTCFSNPKKDRGMLLQMPNSRTYALATETQSDYDSWMELFGELCQGGSGGATGSFSPSSYGGTPSPPPPFSPSGGGFTGGPPTSAYGGGFGGGSGGFNGGSAKPAPPPIPAPYGSNTGSGFGGGFNSPQTAGGGSRSVGGGGGSSGGPPPAPPPQPTATATTSPGGAPSGNRGGLLSAIQGHGGVDALATTERRGTASVMRLKRMTVHEEQNMASALQRAMASRRPAISAGDDSDDDDDDDWEDDPNWGGDDGGHNQYDW